VWAAVEPLIPPPPRTHPLGCHRQRVPDRVCFEAMLVRLVTGCSWVVAERLCGVVSDTTLRARRDEWITAGVFDAVAEEALSAYDRIVGLDLENASIDGSQHKAPGGGEGTGPNCTDRARRGWKWSLATDTAGIPIGWIAAAANSNDCTLAAPTLDAVAARGLLAEVGTVHMDRGYDFAFVRAECANRALHDVVIPPCRRRRPGQPKKLAPLGLRWSIERTTAGCPTSGSSAATPTAPPDTATPSWPWPSPCSSSPSSSTGATAGALSASSLTRAASSSTGARTRDQHLRQGAGEPCAPLSQEILAADTPVWSGRSDAGVRPPHGLRQPSQRATAMATGGQLAVVGRHGGQVHPVGCIRTPRFVISFRIPSELRMRARSASESPPVWGFAI
jgi:transposase